MESFEELERTLRLRLAGDLPGLSGQLPMAPRPRFGWKPGVIPDDCRHGAGLLLLYPVDGSVYVLLTVRDDQLPNHAGQVSLPGGAVEDGESFGDAALREAHEETGVDPRMVRLVGSLSSLHVPVSRFVLHPHVGVCDSRPDLRPEAGEVAEILEVPLELLAEADRHRVERRTYGGRPVQVPFFEVDDQRVWGATAMVLAEFLTVLGCGPDPWGQLPRP